MSRLSEAPGLRVALLSRSDLLADLILNLVELVKAGNIYTVSLIDFLEQIVSPHVALFRLRGAFILGLPVF